MSENRRDGEGGRKAGTKRGRLHPSGRSNDPGGADHWQKVEPRAVLTTSTKDRRPVVWPKSRGRDGREQGDSTTPVNREPGPALGRDGPGSLAHTSPRRFVYWTEHTPARCLQSTQPPEKHNAPQKEGAGRDGPIVLLHYPGPYGDGHPCDQVERT